MLDMLFTQLSFMSTTESTSKAMYVVSFEIARLGKAFNAFWSVMDLGALRHVPIALRETEEMTEMYHQYTEANSLISM